MRRYATKKCRAHDETRVRSEAFRNLASWYAHTANNANKLMIQRAPITVESPLVGTPAGSFKGFTDALAWCEAERDNMTLLVARAFEDGFLDIAWKLPDVLRGFYNLRKALECFLEGLKMRESENDPKALAWSFTNLGEIELRLGNHEAALDHLQRALTARVEVGDTWGDTEHSLDNIAEARVRWSQALDLLTELGDKQAAAVEAKLAATAAG